MAPPPLPSYLFIQFANVLSDFLGLLQQFWAHMKLVWEPEIDKYILSDTDH